MTKRRPTRVLESLTCRRFLLSSWPWRGLAYAVSTALMSGVAWIVLSCLLSPWLFVGVKLKTAGLQRNDVVIAAVTGLLLLAAVGPPIAVAVARIERRRLRLIDERPARSGRTGTGLWSLYTDASTWRELVYLLLLAIVVPIWGLALGLAALGVGSLLATPVAVAFSRGNGVTIGPTEVHGIPQTIPFALIGLALLPLFGYGTALVAGFHGALARALLHVEPDASRRQLVEVVQSRARLVDAFDAERRRIERDLHDGAQQRLVSLSMQLGLASMDLAQLSRSLVETEGDRPQQDAAPEPDGSVAERLTPVVAAVTAAQLEAKALMVELRELIHGINPRTLTELGLVAALTELAERSTVPVEVAATLTERLPSHVESVAYFAVSEALANIAKHSDATDGTITVIRTAGALVVEVRDNGRGGANPDGGTGLTGLADRVAAAGGRLLLSSPAGEGTLVRLELPCP